MVTYRIRKNDRMGHGSDHDSRDDKCFDGLRSGKRRTGCGDISGGGHLTG